MPPPVVERPLLPLLRADLDAAGFTVDGVRSYLGPLAADALDREEVVPALRRTAQDRSPLAVIVRLFTLGQAIPSELVQSAFPRLGVGGLGDLGLIVERGRYVEAGCDLRPYGDESSTWWVTSDLSQTASREAIRGHYVLGIGAASATLAAWTPRVAVDAALDLGAGCGVQAYHLSGHAQRVVATDISARACGFARFNAALAGLDWDIRQGNLFEPVGDERYGLIVSNPPFVITPRSLTAPRLEYRDAGVTGDEAVEILTRRVGRHLEPGGIATFIGNWEVHGAEDWRAPWLDWLEGTGLDAWVIQRDTQDPCEYADTWARDGGSRPGTPEFAHLLEAWLDDFASRDVSAIGFGVVVLQRPRTPRPTFRDLYDAPGRLTPPLGPTVLAGLAARTWLMERSDRELLETRYVAAPDVTLEQHRRPGAGEPSALVVRQGGGLHRALTVDAEVSALVDVCDGDLSADQALTAAAALLGEDAGSVKERVVPVLRELVADGLVQPTGTAAAT